MSSEGLKEEIQFAKKHIRNRFSLMVVPQVFEGMLSIYQNALSVCEKNNQLDQTLKTFQNLLTRIPVWSEDTLAVEVKRITLACKCSFLEELLTGVLLTYLRAFASVQYKNTTDNVEVEFERPPLPKFIHELYKEVARKSWEHAYLYRTIGVSSEQQARNRKEIENVIDTAVDSVLDSFLPWESIVHTYFSEPSSKPAGSLQKGVTFLDDEEEDEENEDAPKLVLSEEDAQLDVTDLTEKEEPVELKVNDDTHDLVLKV